jgi:MFS family permease
VRPTSSLPRVGSLPVHGLSPQSTATVLIAAMFMGSTLLTPLYLLYQRAFGFSEVTLTLIYAAYVLGNLCALFFFGRLSDQIGRRRASLPAMALAAIATLVFLGADGTAWLIVGRMVSGLSIGIASGTAAAWIAELVPGDDKARASAMAAIGNLAGIGVGPLLAGVLAQYAPAPLATSYVVYLHHRFALDRETVTHARGVPIGERTVLPQGSRAVSYTQQTQPTT